MNIEMRFLPAVFLSIFFLCAIAIIETNPVFYLFSSEAERAKKLLWQLVTGNMNRNSFPNNIIDNVKGVRIWYYVRHLWITRLKHSTITTGYLREMEKKRINREQQQQTCKNKTEKMKWKRIYCWVDFQRNVSIYMPACMPANQLASHSKLTNTLRNRLKFTVWYLLCWRYT